MESLDITIILPIKSGLVRDFDEYFDKAIKSLQIQDISLNEIIIVHTEEETLVEKLKNYNFENLNVKLLPYTKEPNFQSQLNYGVENAQSTYVSFFEFDDEKCFGVGRNSPLALTNCAECSLRSAHARNSIFNFLY